MLRRCTSTEGDGVFLCGQYDAPHRWGLTLVGIGGNRSLITLLSLCFDAVLQPRASTEGDGGAGKQEIEQAEDAPLKMLRRYRATLDQSKTCLSRAYSFLSVLVFLHLSRAIIRVRALHVASLLLLMCRALHRCTSIRWARSQPHLLLPPTRAASPSPHLPPRSSAPSLC